MGRCANVIAGCLAASVLSIGAARAELAAVTPERYAWYIEGGPSAIYFTGKDGWCIPCNVLTPQMEAMSERYAGRVRLGRVEVPQNGTLEGALSEYEGAPIPLVAYFCKGERVGITKGMTPPEDVSGYDLEKPEDVERFSRDALAMTVEGIGERIENLLRTCK